MKMTQENMKRFEDMVRDFAGENNLGYRIKHFWTDNQTQIRFDILETGAQRVTLVDWDTKKSLSQAGAVLFSYITREFNLDQVDRSEVPEIKNVIFNDPATIILWEDGTKTIVKCQDGDEYSAELGLAMCIAKKALGNKGNFNEVFKKWLPVESEYPRIILENPSGGMTESFRIKLEEVLNDCYRKMRGRENV